MRIYRVYRYINIYVQIQTIIFVHLALYPCILSNNNPIFIHTYAPTSYGLTQKPILVLHRQALGEESDALRERRTLSSLFG